MSPASPLTYSSLLASYTIVIFAVVIPFEGTFINLTGTTIVSPTLPDASST